MAEMIPIEPDSVRTDVGNVVVRFRGFIVAFFAESSFR